MTVVLHAPPAALRNLLCGLLLTALLGGVPVASVMALEIPYEVDITGIADDALLQAVRDNSALVADADHPPPTTAALRRRVESDLPRLRAVLDSFGHYGATIDHRIDDAAQPARVILAIDPGPQYRLSAYGIAGASPALTDGSVEIDTEDLGVERNDAAEAEPILRSQARLLATLARQSYPLAAITEQNVIVDHEARTVAVELRVDLGPKATFGAVEIEGLEEVRREFVRARLPWRRGEPYDAARVDAGRDRLIESGLFASVVTEPADTVDEDGQLPITIRLAEAKHRSVGAGLSWATSDGFGANVFWEHRNLFGGGQHLNVALLGGETVNGLEADLRAPALPDPRLTYLFAASLRDENREAYDSRTAGGSAALEFAVLPTVTVTGGVSLEYEDITDNQDRSKYTLLGLPLSLTRDTSDDLFDPTRGNRLVASVTPYVSLLGDSTQFIVGRLSDAHYLSLASDDSLILAGWGRIGAIVGDSSADIPATKRLYGGGGGSVRAFGYQMLGPLDSGGDPLGGRSQIALGTELRARITDTIGGVVFVEGGNVYEDPLPDPGEEILWGAGFGLRYYTDLGPIRLDLAFPINPRDEDDLFQLYVSLGQAF